MTRGIVVRSYCSGVSLSIRAEGDVGILGLMDLGKLNGVRGPMTMTMVWFQGVKIELHLIKIDWIGMVWIEFDGQLCLENLSLRTGG